MKFAFAGAFASFRLRGKPLGLQVRGGLRAYTRVFLRHCREHRQVHSCSPSLWSRPWKGIGMSSVQMNTATRNYNLGVTGTTTVSVWSSRSFASLVLTHLECEAYLTTRHASRRKLLRCLTVDLHTVSSSRICVRGPVRRFPCATLRP